VKKAVYISGIITVLLLSLVLTGWADTYDSITKAMRLGNGQYALAEYEDALNSYEAGFEAQTENEALSFNAAQAAYLLGDYEKAAGYYESAEDSVDKYLNIGNIFFRAGGAAEETEQKAQLYTQALKYYKEGIDKYPQNVPLKYNFETVKALLDEMMKESGQDSNNENGDENESENENEGESGEQGNSEDNKNNEGESGEQSESENSEQSESEGQENQAQESENGQDDQSEQNESSGQEEDAQSAQEDGQEEGDEERDAYSDDEGEYDPDQEAVERILAILESQEEESLKNNQEVVGRKDGTNGW